MNLKIYLFPAIYLFVLGLGLTFKKFNTELFMGLMAIVFMGFVIVVYPTPGWFVWSLPFLTYSFVKNSKDKLRVLFQYGTINVIYVLFFLFFYQHPYNPTGNFIFLGEPFNFYFANNQLSDLFFTSLVTLVLVGIYDVFRSAISNSYLYKRDFQAFLIGIAGDSGAGKSTLLKSLEYILGANALTQLEGDAEHKWERGDKNWQEFTHLNPQANHLHKQMLHLIKLKQGMSTNRSDYNHETGKFNVKRLLSSNDFIVLAGLHPFFLEGSRKHFDLKIYIDTHEELRRHWKIARDVQTRGKSLEAVTKQINEREIDAQKYIHPQRAFADIVIRYTPIDSTLNSERLLTVDDVRVEYEVDANIYLDQFFVFISEKLGIKVKSYNYSDDLLRQQFQVELPQSIPVSLLNDEFQDFFELFSIKNVNWQSGASLMNQLLLLHCIRHKYLEEAQSDN